METQKNGNLGDAWQAVLERIRARVPESSFRTWLQSTRLSALNSKNAETVTATVNVPSAFAAEWLQHHYKTLITDTLVTYLERPVILSFLVEKPQVHRAVHALDGILLQPQVNLPEECALPASELKPPTLSWFGPTIQAENKESSGVIAGIISPMLQHRPGTQNSAAATAPGIHLNPDCTFEHFLVGAANRLAVSAAHQMVEEPIGGPRLLFIYGLRGVGKTHLMQAIGNRAQKDKGQRAVYKLAATFDEEEAGSPIPNQDSQARPDLLLIDDLHQIAGWRGFAAQRRLEAELDQVLSQGKDAVVASARPLDSMLALQDSLRTKLRAGRVVAIERPDRELRRAMFRQIAQSAGLNISRNALDLLAARALTMAEICRNWERLQKTRRGRGGEGRGGGRGGGSGGGGSSDEQASTITLLDVEALVSSLDAQAAPEMRIGPDRIIDQVASYFDIEAGEMCTASREKSVIFPRQVAMYLIREETNSSYAWIAHRFARQDHTTSMNSIARIEALVRTDVEARQMTLELRQMIYGEHERLSARYQAS